MLWETYVAIVANVTEDGETKTFKVSTIEAWAPKLIGYIRPILEGYRGGTIKPAIVTADKP